MGTVRTFEIWSEGYAATGQSAGAYRHGRATGTTFKKACLAMAERDATFKQYFNPQSMSYWGCKLFDNESDARARFG